MALQYVLLDENSGFVSEVPVIVPLRWRTKSVSNVHLGPVNNIFANFFSSSSFAEKNVVTLGSWNVGGNANPGRSLCKWQNGSGFFFRRDYSQQLTPDLDAPGNFKFLHISSTVAYQFNDTNIEVDWETTLASLRETYHPSFFDIGAIRFTDVNGENPQDLVKEGLVSLGTINSVYKDTNFVGVEVPKQLLELQFIPVVQEDIQPYGPGGSPTSFYPMTSWVGNGVSNDQDGANWQNTVNEHITNGSQNVCISNGRTIPMYVKLWVKSIVGTGGGDPQNPDETQQSKEGEDSENDPSARGSSGGAGGGSGFGGSTLGSSGQGLNQIGTLFGNSNIPFSSVYITGANYNSFVAAGGGIVSESGVFPNNEGFYIDKVRLSVEGSTMTVVEVRKFDESPSLGLNERVFGYVFDESHVNRPVFSGFVTSRKRHLSGETQEIVYECRDISYYFDQMFSQSVYIYQPPATGGGGITKTYDRVLKEILNVAGIPDAVVSLPSVDAPGVEWIYEPLSSVLEWSTKFFGKYVSYVDRYGRLQVRATDSGSFIKNIPIPAEGTPVGTIHRTMEFSPITDHSRSRSRVVLTGDFELQEKVFKGKRVPQGPKNPEDAGSGFWWYYETINIYGQTKFFYFVFNTSETMLDSLLSDPSKPAEVRMTITTPLSGVGYAPGLKATSTAVLPIWYFQNNPGDGKIIARVDLSAFGTGSILPIELVTGGQNNNPVEYTFEVRYAIKSQSPIQASVNTGLTGGTEVIRRPEFKKISGGNNSVNDSNLMQSYLNLIKDFYKPISGGKLQLEGLDLDLELLGRVSITGTSLPASESQNLIIYEIEYDVPKKLTTVDLSNRVYEDLPFFDVVRERRRRNNDIFVKLGSVEQKTLYGT